MKKVIISSLLAAVLSNVALCAKKDPVYPDPNSPKMPGSPLKVDPVYPDPNSPKMPGSPLR
jgi:predicted small lipoprotein YifL